jgi:hypothetical protein
MATDKSLRQHYAMQGKIKNYLGKQKMVKAPKKWKSGPDHPDTELAYITKAEKDLILKADLHDSLSKGPNRGPSGIISLNSAGSGYGGPGPGSSGGGGNGAVQARDRRAAQANRQAAQDRAAASIREQAAQRSREEAAQRAAAQKAAAQKAEPVYKDPDPVTETVPGDETFKPVVKQLLNIGPSLHGDMKEPEETIQEMIARQQEEKYGVGADPTKLGEIAKPDLRTERETEEDWERAQDWDLIKDMSAKGYDFNEIKGAVEKGLAVKAPTSDRRQNLLDAGLRSLRNIVPETGLEKSLLSRAKSFMPGAKEGIMSGLTGGMGGLSKYFNPKKMAMNFALSKMGLGFLNPVLGIASMFGFNPFKNLGTKYAGLPTKNQPTMGGKGDGGQGQGPGPAPANVIEANIQKFSPEQADMMKQRHSQLQGVIDSGVYQGRQLTAEEIQMLQQKSLDIQKLMEQYLVDPEELGLARGGIASIYG